MIARIAGRLEEITASTVLIDTGDGFWYEVLIPVCDIDRLTPKLGSDVILHTIHHIEGDPSRGGIIPRLIGFLSEGDREFFKAFTKVKGIGVRKALRALARPAAEIAAAIENKDDKLLISLPEIGKRTAEQIIAELHGKLAEFAGDLSSGTPEKTKLPEPALEAVSALVQLGEKHPDASALVERVLAVAPELQSPEEIIQHVYKLKAGIS